MFACAAKEHCEKYGTKKEHFAKIASKNRTQGAQNPRAAIQVKNDIMPLHEVFEFEG